ncbi:hypothetical protein PGTUg99_004785 [Puccinia graminis f. sp. tritici]|uniref:Uncharacterized protein n=1 Tax=Puccinia graminis f. sp. tritici TaxID=56615 RepID=A0A5B0PBI8_PUCGR|nr:hypothetical protein PGTUg99_004785 [Puccinia graminis f. sp. tritici]
MGSPQTHRILSDLLSCIFSQGQQSGSSWNTPSGVMVVICEEFIAVILEEPFDRLDYRHREGKLHRNRKAADVLSRLRAQQARSSWLISDSAVN